MARVRPAASNDEDGTDNNARYLQQISSIWLGGPASPLNLDRSPPIDQCASRCSPHRNDVCSTDPAAGVQLAASHPSRARVPCISHASPHHGSSYSRKERKLTWWHIRPYVAGCITSSCCATRTLATVARKMCLLVKKIPSVLGGSISETSRSTYRKIFFSGGIKNICAWLVVLDRPLINRVCRPGHSTTMVGLL